MEMLCSLRVHEPLASNQVVGERQSSRQSPFRTGQSTACVQSHADGKGI